MVRIKLSREDYVRNHGLEAARELVTAYDRAKDEQDIKNWDRNHEAQQKAWTEASKVLQARAQAIKEDLEALLKDTTKVIKCLKLSEPEEDSNTEHLYEALADLDEAIEAFGYTEIEEPEYGYHAFGSPWTSELWKD